MNILFAISLILFALITAYKTRLGIYIILILIPAYLIRTEIALPALGGIPTTFLELAIYILAIIWLAKKPLLRSMLRNMLRNKKDWKLEIENYLKIGNWKLIIKNPYLLPTALFITAFIISTIISPNKQLSLGILKAWLFDPLLFTIILIDQIKTRTHVNRVVTSLSLMVLWVSIYGLYEYFTHPINLIEYLRLDSIFTSANYVTMLTVPTTILILGYLIKLVRQKQITMKQCNNETMASRLHGFMAPFLVLTTSISIATIYLTRSYSGYLGIAFGILILVLISSAKKKLKTIIIITLIIFSAIFLYTQKDNPKLRALTDLSGHTAIHSRIQIWKTSFAIIKDNPILGIGLGNFHSAYIKYLPKTIENPLEYNVIKPHNLYLNLWLETGLLGLIAFLWLIVIFYKKTTSIENCKLKIENSAVIAAAMTAILVQGLLDTPYFKNDLSLIFWLLIGLTIINKKAREHTNEHTKTQEKCQSG